MKTKPILFSTPMVRAIMEGNKTMTRRTVKSDANSIQWQPIVLNGYGGFCDDHGNPVKCKYEIDDVLWVRETWQKVDSYPEPDCFGKYLYKSMGDTPAIWKPSIFMPKDACRIFLKITDVKIERLQDISEEDAIKEGINLRNTSGDWEHSPVQEFETLWTKINGKESWSDNPFVWVVSFEKIEKPEGFV